MEMISYCYQTLKRHVERGFAAFGERWVSRDTLTVVANFASGDGPPSQLEVAELRRCLGTYFRSNGSLTMERCFGFDRKTRNEMNMSTRNYWLGVAHSHCEGPTPWSKSVTLADELARFQTEIWPAWRDMIDPPPGSSELRSALFHAFHATKKIITDSNGLKLPNTARGLHEIIQKS